MKTLGITMLKTILSACLIIFAVVDAQIRISGENDKCAKFCDDTYANEAKNGSESLKSCKQGCRYFSLEQMMPDSDYKLMNESDVRQKCVKLCVKSYPSNAHYSDACQKGCDNQSMFVSGAMEVHVDGTDPAFKAVSDDLMSPAMSLMKTFEEKFQKILDRTKNFFNNDDSILNRISSMFDRDPNMVDISPPDFLDQLPNLGNGGDIFGNSDEKAIDFPRMIGGAEDVFGAKPIQAPKSKSDRSDKSSPESQDEQNSPTRKMLKNLENQFAGPTVDDKDDQGEPVIVVHMIPIDTDHDELFNNRNNMPNKPQPVDLQLIHNDEDSTLLKETANEPSPPLEYISEDDWFACLSRRVRHLSMITRWMLCVALLLSIASMLWICLAIIRTAPRRRLRYLATIQKGGIDNVYYTTPPATASDKSPMIIKTCDFKAQPEAPPPYEPEMAGVKVEKEGQKVSSGEEKEQA